MLLIVKKSFNKIFNNIQKIIIFENIIYSKCFKVPTRQISFHILEKYILNRLEYLQLLYENKSHEFKSDFEYLLENSAYEKIGHFILR